VEGADVTGEHSHTDLEAALAAVRAEAATGVAALSAALGRIGAQVTTLEAEQRELSQDLADLLDAITPPPLLPARPGPSSTGHLSAAADLVTIIGDVTLRTAGTVLEGKRITGKVRVKANDCVVRDCLITGTGTLIEAWDGFTGLLVEDTTLAPAIPSITSQGIHGGGYTARRLNVSGVVDGFGAFGPAGKPADVTVVDSWVHDLHCAPDPSRSDGITHGDCVQLHGGGRVEIRRNTLTANAGPTSIGGVAGMSCVMMAPGSRGPAPGVVIEGNWLDHGTACLNLGLGTAGVGSDVTVVGNRFGRNGGHRILAAKGLPLTHSGNVYDDDGTPVAVSPG
jgi:hypothetical protein